MAHEDLTEGEPPEELHESGKIGHVDVPDEIEESLRREREDGTAAREEEELG